MELVVVPGRPQMSAESFLEAFGVTDGSGLGLQLLQESVERRDPLDVELALVVCFRFGFSDAHLGPLLLLAVADWHERHEDVASALGKVGSPESVEALVHLAELVPSYLDYDESGSLARKAIWALGSIRDDKARRALDVLARSGDPLVAESAKAQVEK